jgi:hypothetical protein
VGVTVEVGVGEGVALPARQICPDGSLQSLPP